MENLDLLNTNKFVPTGVYSLSNDKKKEDYLRKQMEFRQYMESKKTKFTMGGGDSFNNDLSLDDLSNSNAIDFKVQPNPAAEVKKTKSKTLNRPSSVSIDSRDRDSVTYTDANKYKIKLNKTFVNVSRVGLKSTEFPNTQQLIRGSPASISNNLIAWQNETDTITRKETSGLPDTTSGYITYKTSIQAGNYDAGGLQKEIQTKMNTVTRKVYTTTDNQDSYTTSIKPHTFTVTINTTTDETEITSVEYNNYSNVLHTREKWDRVYFAQKLSDTGDSLVPHKLKTGDRIFIQDANDIGGIADSEINGEHVITLDTLEDFDENETTPKTSFFGSSTKDETNVYYFNTSTKSSLSVVFAGGTSIKIGTGVGFRMMWDQNNTSANVLGFKNLVFPARLYDKQYVLDSNNNPTDVLNTDHYKAAGNTTATKITMTTTMNSNVVKTHRVGHNLITGDYISMENWPTNKPIGGIFPSKLDSLLTYVDYEVRRIDDDNFEWISGIKSNIAHTIEFNGQNVKNSSGNYVPIIFYDKAVKQSFALVVNNTVIKTRLNIYKILRATETVNNITTTVDTKARVYFTTEHGMNTGDKIYIYFDGLYGYTKTNTNQPDDPRTAEQIKAVSEISNPVGVLIEKFDDTSVLVPIKEFPNDITWGDNNPEYELTKVWNLVFGLNTSPDETKKYGEGIIKTLSKGINLDGENYIYFCINEFPAMVVSSKVDNVFYKLILNGSPGATLYNTFVGNAYVPKEGLIPKLEYLNITFRTQDNNLFQFNNAEHSFTLEVTEVVDMPETSGMSSRRGK